MGQEFRREALDGSMNLYLPYIPHTRKLSALVPMVTFPINL